MKRVGGRNIAFFKKTFITFFLIYIIYLIREKKGRFFFFRYAKKVYNIPPKSHVALQPSVRLYLQKPSKKPNIH